MSDFIDFDDWNKEKSTVKIFLNVSMSSSQDLKKKPDIKTIFCTQSILLLLLIFYNLL